MILKIQMKLEVPLVKEEAWAVFDNFDRILYRPIDGKNEMPLNGAIDLRARQSPSIGMEGYSGMEIELFNDGVFKERIFAHRPIFLLNNRGETIERI